MWDDQLYGSSYGAPVPQLWGWTFVAAVWTPTSQTIYENGVGYTLAAATTPADLSVGPIILGNDVYNTQVLDGRMQEVAIFTNALTADQIEDLYNAGQPLPQNVSVTQTPPGPTNYEGQTITFSASSYGSVTVGYQWLKNALPLSGQTAATLVLNDVLVTNSGNYSVVVSNVYGAVTSPAITLDVVAGPPLIVQQPAPAAATRCLNGSVTFTVSAVGTVPLSYQWQDDNVPISGATTTSLTLTGLQFASAGSYNVVVINPHGTNTSANAVLTVNGVAANYASAVVALGPQAYWRLNETNGTTAYDYVGGYNGTIAGAITLGQPGPAFPGLDASNTAFVFGGTSSTTNAVTTPLLINGVAGTFIALVNATDPGGTYNPGIMEARGGTGNPIAGGACCGFGLDVDGVTVDYQWANQSDTWGWPTLTNGSGLQVPPNTWCFVAVSVSQQQTIIYTDSGNGLSSETNQVPTVGVTNTGPLLLGCDAQWGSFIGGIDEAAYFNRALTPAETMALDQTLVSNVPLGAPVILVQPVPQTAYLGSAASFTVSAAGVLPMTYQWQFNSANITGATGQTLVIPNVSYANAGLYQVVLSGAVNPSATSQPAQLAVLEPVVQGSGDVTYGLVAHYKFDGNCADSSGNGNNGFAEGSPSFVAGKIGEAISVYDDRSSVFNYVNLGDPTDFQFNAGQSFSVSLWLNYTGTPGDLPIIGNAIGSTWDPGWLVSDSFYDDGGGNIACWLEGSVTYSFFLATNQVGAGVMNDGNWHHFVMAVDQVNNVVTAYADGVLANSAAVKLGSLNTGYPTVIGNDPTGEYTGANAAGGYTIDDVGIWNRALAPAEVAAIYSAGTNGAALDSFGPVPMTVTKTAAGQLQILWQRGTLMSAPALTGTWTPVTGATAPVYTVAPTNSQQFYRVQ